MENTQNLTNASINESTEDGIMKLTGRNEKPDVLHDSNEISKDKGIDKLNSDSVCKHKEINRIDKFKKETTVYQGEGEESTLLHKERILSEINCTKTTEYVGDIAEKKTTTNNDNEITSEEKLDHQQQNTADKDRNKIKCQASDNDNSDNESSTMKEKNVSKKDTNKTNFRVIEDEGTDDDYDSYKQISNSDQNKINLHVSDSTDAESTSKKNQLKKGTTKTKFRVIEDESTDDDDDSTSGKKNDNKDQNKIKLQVSDIDSTDDESTSEKKLKRGTPKTKLRVIEDESSDDEDELSSNMQQNILKKDQIRTKLEGSRVKSDDEETEMISDKILQKLKEIGDDSTDDENDGDEDEVNSELLEELNKPRKVYPQERKSKTISKMMMKETKSEQQRLKREMTINIPYHKPNNKTLKDFLQRVPKIEKKADHFRSPSTQLTNSEEKPSIKGIFKVKPRLSQPEEIDNKKTNGGLDFFMKRFAKHADCKTASPKVKPIYNNESPTISGAERGTPKNPGSVRLELKDQLKTNIMRKRQEYHIDMEKQLQFYDEEAYGDEDEDFGESDDSDDEDEDPDNINDNEEKHEAIIGDDKDTQEVATCDKEHHEVVTDEKEFNFDLPKTENIVTSHSFDLPYYDFHVTSHEQDHWEDSSSNISSIIHPGQGEPSNKKLISTQVDLTPFTKLLKSGLLDSASKDSNSRACSEVPSLSLPNEDTQDLYKDSNNDQLFADDDDPSQKFELALDEDTQFGQVFNSQGFFQETKKKKKETVKRLFDDDDQKVNGTMSMTQVLGFCSGEFNSIEEGDKICNDDKDAKNKSDYDDIDNDADDAESIKSAADINNDQESNQDNINDQVEGEYADTEVDVKEKKFFIESDGDSDDEELNELEHKDENEKDDDDDDDEEEIISKEDEKVGEWNKKRFYEEEAELSGSDVNSDEEELGSEYDEYELDPEAENEHTSTHKLKKQVHKIHQRKMMDKDKKEIRLLQELYLEDGDLGDRMKRKRNFRWNNNIDDYENNPSVNDESGDENIDEIDIQKRMNRLERENFINEMQRNQRIKNSLNFLEIRVNEPLVIDDCSQSVLKRISSTVDLKETRVESKRNSYPSSQNRKFKRSGSFLGGGNKAAVKAPPVNASTNKDNRTSKRFVFQVADSPKENRRKDKVDPPTSGGMEPPRKVIKLDKKLNNKSVFNLM